MVLPLRSKNPPESFPFATVALIVANVLVYIVTTQNGLELRRSSMEALAVRGADFTPLRILTAMFLHGDLFHLLGNLWFLALFGFAVEGRLRWFRFVPLYLLAGVGGDVLDFMIQGKTHPEIWGLGASGAIMGVVGAAIWMFPYGKVTTLWTWGYRIGVTDWPMWGSALYFLGFDLLWALLDAKDGVGHLAHLGGALVGFLLCMAFRPTRDSEGVSDSKAALAEVKDLAVLGRVELAEMHRVNPTDPLIALHWMDKSLRDPYGLKPECVEAFLRLYPRMRRDLDPRVLAAPVLGLAAQGWMKARDMIALAGDLERATDPLNAMRLYETAYGMPDAGEAEQETACFRTGLLAENVAHAPERAAACYKEVLHRWPMGAFADQAKSRLTNLQRRVSV